MDQPAYRVTSHSFENDLMYAACFSASSCWRAPRSCGVMAFLCEWAAAAIGLGTGQEKRDQENNRQQWQHDRHYTTTKRIERLNITRIMKAKRKQRRRKKT